MFGLINSEQIFIDVAILLRDFDNDMIMRHDLKLRIISDYKYGNENHERFDTTYVDTHLLINLLKISTTPTKLLIVFQL